MACHRSNTTDVTSGSGPAYYSRAHEFTPSFNRCFCCSIFRFMCSALQIIVYSFSSDHCSLTRSGFEPSINHSRGEHTNHYTTDVVQKASNGYYRKVVHVTSFMKTKYTFYLSTCMYVYIKEYFLLSVL